MTRAHLDLPDELYKRALRFAEARKMTLGEMALRGLELFLATSRDNPETRSEWTLPKIDVGEILVPLEKLHEISADEEARRSLPG